MRMPGTLRRIAPPGGRPCADRDSEARIGSFAVPPRFSRLALLVATCIVATLVGAARPARAAARVRRLVYSFQPDCYQPKGDGTCGQTLQHLDFGPQIAVWIETSNHALVDTLMVTSLTATRGHREPPRRVELPLGAEVPIRQAMDVVAAVGVRARQALRHRLHAGRSRDLDGLPRGPLVEGDILLPPRGLAEINLAVDVVTCPSQNFNSAKGKLESTTKSYYPPRNDLTMFTNSDCDNVGGHALDVSRERRDLRGAQRSRRRRRGDAALRQAVHAHVARPADAARGRLRDRRRGEQGVRHERLAPAPVVRGREPPELRHRRHFGQPSVLYRVPVHLGDSTPTEAVVSQIAGYSKWTGDAPLDGTLCRGTGRSRRRSWLGELRLVAFDGPGGNGRVHVALSRCPGTPMCADGGCPTSASDDGSAPDALGAGRVDARGHVVSAARHLYARAAAAEHRSVAVRRGAGRDVGVGLVPQRGAPRGGPSTATRFVIASGRS